MVGYAIATFGFDLEYGGKDAVMTELWIDPAADTNVDVSLDNVNISNVCETGINATATGTGRADLHVNDSTITGTGTGIGMG